MELQIIAPEEIEKESFRIIEEELKKMGIAYDEETGPVLKRVIHTTADFSYTDTLKFLNDPMKKARACFRENTVIITDTNMALSGINKTNLHKLNMQVKCFMSDEDVAKEAKERNVTRAVISMERAAKLKENKIFVVGNAPTALIEIHNMIRNGSLKPELIVGVPVGFVNVEYSKELFRDTDIPAIINFGRKGGSNVAAAIINGLMKCVLM